MLRLENIQEIVDMVVDAGRIMLESGSEIYRSEETMVRIARCYGLESIDIFTLATCIYVTCEIDGNSYTRIKRVRPKATDLSRISRINQLSRDLEKEPLSLDGCKEKLAKIEKSSRFSHHMVALTMALACAVFAFMLENCGLQDVLWTGVVSYLAYWVLAYLNRYPTLHLMVKNAMVAMVIALGAIVCVETGLGQSMDAIIIGGIMLLVPGVALTNAFRDILNGDILSGVIRIVEAVIIAIGIALGVGIVLFFYTYGLGVLV